jgi:dipeptidyl aminopeptidase/acylaminoacyl peptidase
MKIRMLFSFLCAFNGFATIAQDQVPYKEPPAEIRQLFLAPTLPSVSVSRKGEWMLILERKANPTVAEMAEPEIKTGGLRMNPANFGPSRSTGISKIIIKNLLTKTEFPVKGLPLNLRAGSLQWSPNDSMVAFTQTMPDRIDLYVIKLADQSVRKINTNPLNTLAGPAFAWIGSNALLYKSVPTGRPSLQPRSPVPNGPIVQENLGKTNASRTYQDLIKSPYDEELFAYMLTSQLMMNDFKTEKPLGKPDVFTNMSVSPDTKYLMLTALEKPYSYLVPFNGFPQRVFIMNSSGLIVKVLTKNPSSESVPTGFDDVSVHPRSFQWRADKPATIVYVQALDNGLGKSKAAFRDAVYATGPQFQDTAQLLFKTKRRYNGIVWGNDNLSLVYESMFADRRERVSRFNPTTGQLDSLFEKSSNDDYSSLGDPVTIKNAFGRDVLYVSKTNQLLFTSEGSSPNGDLPLLQSYDLASAKKNNLWHCVPGYYETIVSITDPEKGLFVTQRESLTETPNYFLRDLKKPAAAGTALTSFTNPYPQLDGITKIKVSYMRRDSVGLTGDLYLPKGYTAKEQGPLPVLIWAYPREYKSASDAAQVRGSQFRFPRLNAGSPIFWVTQGYAVLDNAEMPIVGERDAEPNDSFIPQLYLNAHAAIQHLAILGVGDSNRVAVGGHSYGAFMTANLLAHTNLFKAGIARSGAYNRTLTPFGFQAEERTYWQSPEVYFNMSPFSFANKIKTPILLIHGEMDNNSGTFPIQSERFYNAIKGHGGTVRYVQLPYESHGYTGKENLLHMLWEQHQWLEKYVKNAGK